MSIRKKTVKRMIKNKSLQTNRTRSRGVMPLFKLLFSIILGLVALAFFYQAFFASRFDVRSQAAKKTTNTYTTKTGKVVEKNFGLSRPTPRNTNTPFPTLRPSPKSTISKTERWNMPTNYNPRPTPITAKTLPILREQCTTKDGWVGTCKSWFDCRGALSSGRVYEEAACDKFLIGCCATNPESSIGKTCTTSKESWTGVCTTYDGCFGNTILPAFGSLWMYDAIKKDIKYEESKCDGGLVGCCGFNPDSSVNKPCWAGNKLGICSNLPFCDEQNGSWQGLSECGGVDMGCCSK